MGSSGPKAFFLALAWARRIPNGPWWVSASPARAGVSLLFLFVHRTVCVVLHGIFRPRFAPLRTTGKTWQLIRLADPRFVDRPSRIN